MPLDVKATAGGTLVEVRASPGSSRDAVRGEHGGRLKVAVTAPPEKGRANAAVAKVIAKELGVAAGSVELVAGARSRDKTYVVRGLGPQELLSKLGYLF